MTFIDVAQDVVFHLHDETSNKFLHAGKKKKKRKKDRKGEEYITFACLMPKQVRKCSLKINQLKPLKNFLGLLLFDHLDNLLL